MVELAELLDTRTVCIVYHIDTEIFQHVLNTSWYKYVCSMYEIYKYKTCVTVDSTTNHISPCYHGIASGNHRNDTASHTHISYTHHVTINLSSTSSHIMQYNTVFGPNRMFTKYDRELMLYEQMLLSTWYKDWHYVSGAFIWPCVQCIDVLIDEH